MNDFKTLREKAKILKKAAQILRVEEKDLIKVVERFRKEIEEMKSR